MLITAANTPPTASTSIITENITPPGSEAGGPAIAATAATAANTR